MTYVHASSSQRVQLNVGTYINYNIIISTNTLLLKDIIRQLTVTLPQ